MRAFLLALVALALPLTLSACAESAQEEAVEEGAPAGDQEDVLGDGEVIDEAGEPEGNMMDGAMTGDSTTMDQGPLESEMTNDTASVVRTQ
ncbi:MAG TPA: hypothetical protein VF594_03060 [Rubricoccaceae bacterium]|jgi:hypothetical protein